MDKRFIVVHTGLSSVTVCRPPASPGSKEFLLTERQALNRLAGYEGCDGYELFEVIPRKIINQTKRIV